jgi:leucine efflux protein
MGVMWGVTDLWTYVLGTVAIVLLPGPNSLFVAAVSARQGIRAGYRAAGGVFLGDAVLMVGTAAGAASLLTAYPALFTIVKYAGAAYLAYVGCGIVRSAWRRRRDPITTPSATRPGTTVGLATAVPAPAATPAGAATRDGAAVQSDQEPEAAVRRPFQRAFVISLLNPKAILFFVSFFVQFVDPGYPWPAVSFLLLGAILQVCSALYLTGLIFGGRYLAAQFDRRRRLARVAATGVGALFVGFGIKLATASIS